MKKAQRSHEHGQGYVCGPDGCRPLTDADKNMIEALLKSVDKAKARRTKTMPATEDALRVLMDAYVRLKELGWRDAIYCPKDGTRFDAIEVGSTGIHTCFYMGEWPNGGWWIEDDDVWPSRPILFRERKP